MEDEAKLLYTMKKVLINIRQHGTCYSAIPYERQEIGVAIDHLIKMGLLAGGHTKPYLTDEGELLLFDMWNSLFSQRLIEIYHHYIVERDLLGVKD